MPTHQTQTHRMTVRHSDVAGELEVTIRPADLLELSPGWGMHVRSRRALESTEAVQLRFDRNDAMILSSMLEEIAYSLPMPDNDVLETPA